MRLCIIKLQFDYGRGFNKCCLELTTWIVLTLRLPLPYFVYTFFLQYHQIQEQFRGKSIMCAIDRLETLKGIPLKLLGFERFLQRRPDWVGKVVLIQIGISAFERGDDYLKTKAVVIEMAESINRRWPGSVQFQECVESEMRLHQRLAILRAADIALITPVRDGLNQIPLEFSFCHRDATTPQGMSDGRKRGICIISDFASSSRIMRGSIHVNPWKIAEMANAFDMALNMSNEERLRRVNISSEYVVRVTAQRWALAVLLDLKGVQKNEDVAQYSGAGLGLNYRLLGMDKGFVSLDTNMVAKSYKNARARLILLDYGGTILHNDNVSVDLIIRFIGAIINIVLRFICLTILNFLRQNRLIIFSDSKW